MTHQILLYQHYFVRIHTTMNGIEDHWEPGCKGVAFVWNTLAGIETSKGTLSEGESLFGMKGFAGKVWVGPTNEWNVRAANDKGEWSGWIPINEIVTEIRRLSP